MAKEVKTKRQERTAARAEGPSAPMTPVVAAAPPRLKEQYLKEMVPALMRRFGYRNIMQAPRLRKVVVNMGVGKATQDIKLLESAMRDLGLITGQKPALRRAKKSIAAFRLRAGMPVGCVLTLRADRMYEFLDRLISAALPRIRDFRGLPRKSVDGRGNYSLGLRDQLIFPELSVDHITAAQGMDITIVTTARTDEEALALLEQLGLPLREA